MIGDGVLKGNVSQSGIGLAPSEPLNREEIRRKRLSTAACWHGALIGHSPRRGGYCLISRPQLQWRGSSPPRPPSILTGKQHTSKPKGPEALGLLVPKRRLGVCRAKPEMRGLAPRKRQEETHRSIPVGEPKRQVPPGQSPLAGRKRIPREQPGRPWARSWEERHYRPCDGATK